MARTIEGCRTTKFGPDHPSRVILFRLNGTLIKHGSAPYQWTDECVSQLQACNALLDEIFNRAKQEVCAAITIDEQSIEPSFAAPYHPGFDKQFLKIEPIDIQASNTDTLGKRSN